MTFLLMVGIIFSHLFFIFAPSKARKTIFLPKMNTLNSKNSIAMKNEEKKNILTKEDLFRIIDSRLSTEEKSELMKADPADLRDQPEYRDSFHGVPDCRGGRERDYGNL